MFTSLLFVAPAVVHGGPCGERWLASFDDGLPRPEAVIPHEVRDGWTREGHGWSSARDTHWGAAEIVLSEDHVSLLIRPRAGDSLLLPADVARLRTQVPAVVWHSPADFDLLREVHVANTDGRYRVSLARGRSAEAPFQTHVRNLLRLLLVELPLTTAHEVERDARPVFDPAAPHAHVPAAAFAPAREPGAEFRRRFFGAGREPLMTKGLFAKAGPRWVVAEGDAWTALRTPWGKTQLAFTEDTLFIRVLYVPGDLAFGARPFEELRRQTPGLEYRPTPPGLGRVAGTFVLKLRVGAVAPRRFESMARGVLQSFLVTLPREWKR